ncbi:hypothetical protein [Leptospira santarosai]|uniref:Uncharacterized protein n=4 Tax=Leptospira santarosai TaxID=28183 RepID=M6V4W1_9LEPT|nr:hypothetical protein [Leptospira santarosai]EMO56279.1 hypothetical protein LEP1GSC161_3928 [Leptospira santarosai str. CBC1416]ASV11707.1 hypothetical protein B2G51_08120 [Leptospira santarosai]EKO35065.1 hypothetical protein LEP1GSC179_0013 [Leptospira santarosai str. MOR084]EKR90361.1 hypothetical protein LEP1GSC163_0445 [Leptospira santarosai str. CBC379]EKT85140.1 hypothetical protein LSS_19078 [Leptospira santarosai serovar Shermani str. LT 821]
MALRKPKTIKSPKKPKKSASPEVKQRYLDRVAHIEKENKTRVSKYETRKKKDNELNRKIFG